MCRNKHILHKNCQTKSTQKEDKKAGQRAIAQIGRRMLRTQLAQNPGAAPVATNNDTAQTGATNADNADENSNNNTAQTGATDVDNGD